MNNLPAKTIEDSIWIKADPARVFQALIHENELLMWFPDESAKIDPHVGGEVLFTWTGGGELRTTVLAFVPDKELTYGFYGGEEEPVTYKLTAENGGTRVNLSHFIPAGGDLDMFIGIASNWAHLLDGLKCWVEKGWDIR